jgi:sulfur transfer complex TusBCD TusB component (DsrH family)
LPVVFDFDNTIVCGDIGEATLAVLARDGDLTARGLAGSLAPPFVTAQGQAVSLATAVDVTAYYEAFLDPTAHDGADPTPAANGYVWAVEIMRGLSPLEVVRATRKAYRQAVPSQEVLIEVTPGQTAYPLPFFYRESLELMAELLRHDFDLWVISASNVWSVRWMVLNGLNPILASMGVRRALVASQVVGVSTLVADRQSRLHKDTLLVRENPAYAAMEGRYLGSLRLTGRLHFPVPTYSGKVACIWDLIGRRPYLAVGDSPGDHAMLAFSENRLWIARLEKPGYQQATVELMQRTGPARWIIQPTLCKRAPGFVQDAQAVERALGTVPPNIQASLAVPWPRRVPGRPKAVAP